MNKPEEKTEIIHRIEETINRVSRIDTSNLVEDQSLRNDIINLIEDSIEYFHNSNSFEWWEKDCLEHALLLFSHNLYGENPNTIWLNATLHSLNQAFIEIALRAPYPHNKKRAQFINDLDVNDYRNQLEIYKKYLKS